jgi:hypothetical protein
MLSSEGEPAGAAASEFSAHSKDFSHIFTK